MSHYSLAQKPAELSKLVEALEKYRSIEKYIDKRVKKDQYRPIKQKQTMPFWVNDWRKQCI